MPKVLNKRKNTPKEYRPHKDAVYVGRPTVWGNPFNGKDRIKNINSKDSESDQLNLFGE